MEQKGKDDLTYVIQFLQKEVSAIESALKGNISDEARVALISQVMAIKFSQQLLRRCFEYRIGPQSKWRRIPEPGHRFSEYRLLEDFDSDDRTYWKELDDIRPLGGAVLIE